jgi:transposase
MIKRVLIHYLPAYCPELNLIEILWRRIKYQWLPLSSYTKFSTFRENVTHILQNLGKKYTLTFVYVLIINLIDTTVSDYY